MSILYTTNHFRQSVNLSASNVGPRLFGTNHPIPNSLRRDFLSTDFTVFRLPTRIAIAPGRLSSSPCVHRRI